MWVDDYHWHYDYARLAWDTGFCFDKFKYPNLDRNKICLIDIERIIKERDVASVDRNISTVVQYILDNDQAEVLGTNFVKLFRLSQLSVEYLLFCKKYLDRTVSLLKKELMKLREEVKELKLYTEELETHISSSRNQPIIAFKCEICSKAFSSEEYLQSHLKRRHNGDDNKVASNSDAEKLHSEIKELKERLNNTEKFIQEKPCEKETDNQRGYHYKEDSKEPDDKTTKLVGEIQESFEKFRKQVEEKMTNLQSEKNYFIEKYDKLFEMVLQYKNKEQEIPKIEEYEVNEIPKIENTTQTIESDDKPNKMKKLQMYTVQHDEIFDTKKEDASVTVREENIDEKIEKKLLNFEENIESKISTGLCNIENQIQAFWQKVELQSAKITDQSTETQSISPNSPTNKPKIKPRTKLTKTSTENIGKENSNAKRIKTELDQMLSNNKSKPKLSVSFDSKPDPKPTVVKAVNSKMYETTSEEEESTEEDEDEEFDIADNLKMGEHKAKTIASSTLSMKKNKPQGIEKTIKKSSEPSKISINKSKSLVKKANLPNAPRSDRDHSEKMTQHLRKQLNDLVDASLQEMGISPHWRGIPKKTFDRALEIVNHQAALTKKSLPEYDFLKKSIEKSLKPTSRPKKAKHKNQISVVKKHSPSDNKFKHNVIKLQIRKKQQQESIESEPPISIKNRSLYDTESETDIKMYLPNRDAAHSAVIEELQSKLMEKSHDTDSDLDSVMLPNDEKEIKEKKSAMRSHPFEGNLSKKKVIFDVQDSVGKEEEVMKEKDKDSSLSNFELT